MAKKFVHLHVHTEYSLLDGLSKISDLIHRVKELEMESAAITDHGVMYGAVEFYKKANKEGIKPLIGMEAYTTNIDHKLRPERGKVKNYHLLLLAKNNQGYQNLMKLTSIAHCEGFYYRPRFDHETLAKYSKGLICTSACPQGEIAKALISGDFEEAKAAAGWHQEVFGEDYYLELQRHGYANNIKEITDLEVKKNVADMQGYEKDIEKGVITLSRELGIPIVATNDAHYIFKEDAQAQDALVCIATGKNVSETKRLRFIDTPTFYLTSPGEMNELFTDIPEALENTFKISEKCEVAITLDKWFFPKFPVDNKSPEDELKDLSHEGINGKIASVTKEVSDRLEYELDTISNKGYATYFLIVADLTRWCYQHGILTNTRGSTAGSLVAYALGIVDINPLDYNLPFERMLTPWRPSPPDIDLDIADDRREEVISYMETKYGSENVAQICTFGRMMARGAVRDTARVLGYPYSTGDRIAKLIPVGSQGFPMTINQAFKVSSDLKNLYESDSDSKKVLDLARNLEGNARHISVHAAGVVIAPDEITTFTPVQKDPEGERIITQYDMDSLDPNVSPNEAVGLLKFDLLGLRNLSILGACIEIIKKTKGLEVDIKNIPLTDKKTFKMLSIGDTMGVFQLSGGGMTRYLKELKPTRVEDIMAMVALYRPGPMSQIPVYIERKNNPSRVSYLDPRMKEYLDKSYGLLVYQDDVFMTVIKIAGYTWEESDKFRKAVGKKIPAEMQKQKEKFINGAIKNGLTTKKAEELFSLIEPFSGYGFNKAHAASYGMLAYQTAYLKANFPIEYMTALLTAESKDTQKITSAINECKRMGIKILPPDINESDVGFTIIEDKESLGARAIRFGLDAIKNVGKAAIDSILEAREFGKFLSLNDFCNRIDARRVNKKVLESLIKVGGMTQFGARAALLSAIGQIKKITRPSRSAGQQDLFSEKEVKAKPREIIKIISDIQEFSQDELQQLERSLLGFSLSARPLTEILGILDNLITHKIFELIPERPQTKVVVAGVLTTLRIVVTKKSGSEMAFAKIEDETGVADLVIFPKIYNQYRGILLEYKPLLISGSIDTRDENPTIVVDEIRSKEDVESKERELLIKIPAGIGSDSLIQLKKLLLRHPGKEKVALVFAGVNKKTMPLAFGVSWDEKLSRLISEALNITISTPGVD